MFSGRKCESLDKALFLLVALLMAIAVQARKQIVVDHQGTEDFKTIQDALDVVPAGNTAPVTIFVKQRIYREVVVVDARKGNILLNGEDKNTTNVCFNHHLNGLDGLNNCQKNKLDYTL